MRDLLMTSRIDIYPWGKMIWLIDGQTTKNPNMSLTRMEVDVGSTSEYHQHANCHECIHVLEGSIMGTVDDKEIQLSAGDTVFVPQGSAHMTQNIGVKPAVLMISYSEAIRKYTPVEPA